MTRFLVLFAAMACLAFAVAGCGGDDDDENPAAAWATDFCTTIESGRSELEGIASQFTDPSSLSEDALQAAATDARDATGDLVDDLRALGAPPTESGEQVESAIDSLATTLETESGEIEAAVQTISGITSIPSALSTISASLSAITSAFQSTLTTVESADVAGEVRTALEEAPECDNLTSSS